MGDDIKTIITVTPKTGNRFKEMLEKWASFGESGDRDDSDNFLTYLMGIASENDDQLW